MSRKDDRQHGWLVQTWSAKALSGLLEVATMSPPHCSLHTPTRPCPLPRQHAPYTCKLRHTRRDAATHHNGSQTPSPWFHTPLSLTSTHPPPAHCHACMCSLHLHCAMCATWLPLPMHPPHPRLHLPHTLVPTATKSPLHSSPYAPTWPRPLLHLQAPFTLTLRHVSSYHPNTLPTLPAKYPPHHVSIPVPAPHTDPTPPDAVPMLNAWFFIIPHLCMVIRYQLGQGSHKSAVL
jgi:hypothetical protein